MFADSSKGYTIDFNVSFGKAAEQETSTFGLC